MNDDELFNYLVATDQLDEFLGKKESEEDIEEDEEQDAEEQDEI